MNINEMINQLTWKKIVVIALLFFAASWVLREMLFWSYIREFQQTMSQFNTQFEQDQKAIHNKIVESDVVSDKWNKQFEKNSNDVHEAVEKNLKDTMQFLQDSRAQMEEHQNKFYKEFDEMPEKMWKAYEAFGERMFANHDKLSKKENDALDKEFSQQDAENKAKQAEFKKEKDAIDKKTWEAARIRYHEQYGTWLPTYEEFTKKKS